MLLLVVLLELLMLLFLAYAAGAASDVAAGCSAGASELSGARCSC